MHAVIDTTDTQFNDYWNRLVATDPLQNPLYAVARSSHDADNKAYTNHSFMVLSEQEPVFGCSLTSSTDADGRCRLGFFGREASTLVNRNKMETPSNNFKPEAIRLLQEHFCAVMERMSPDYLEYLDPVSCGLMSPLTQVLLERGAMPVIRKTQRINLALSETALRHMIDAEYQRCISWGEENLSLSTVDGEQLAGLDSGLPELFDQVWGDASQSGHDCWRSCEELVRDDYGFVIRGAGEHMPPVHALFVHNGHTCHFVLTDADQTQSQMPVIHALIWQAIRQSKKRGCAWFDVGGLQSGPASFEPEKFGGASHSRIKISLAQ